jgi:zeaxanthin glucosyltransferase
MKIGFVSMPLRGHLNPMTALARKLRSRGRDVTFFGLLDAERVVRAAGLDFVSFGEEEYPIGFTPASYAHLSKLKGDEVTRYSFQEMHPRRCQTTLMQLPKKLAEADIQALVIDTTHHFVQLIPLSMGMPYVQIWNTLHFDGSGATPPFNFDWPHETTPEAIARNLEGVKKMDLAFAPVREVAKSWARENNLEIDWHDPRATVSQLAVITQTPKEFDFEGGAWPEAFHYAGPFHDDEGRESVPFPWEELTGEPLIFASMGTLVNGLEHVFRAILEVVGQIPRVQLVLSMGHNLRLDHVGRIPSNAIVIPTAPQLKLLSRAKLCITHAGINTVLESLAFGVPMVAIPVGFDQPGIAARVKYHGVGETVPVGSLTIENLSEAVTVVLENPSYRDKAQYFKEVIAKKRGLDIAADIIEQVFSTGDSLTRRQGI